MLGTELPWEDERFRNAEKIAYGIYLDTFTKFKRGRITELEADHRRTVITGLLAELEKIRIQNDPHKPH